MIYTRSGCEAVTTVYECDLCGKEWRSESAAEACCNFD